MKNQEENKLEKIEKNIQELQNTKIKEKYFCNICTIEEINCIFNCGHLCCCLNCSNNINNCPICRKEIIEKKVFRS